LVVHVPWQSSDVGPQHRGNAALHGKFPLTEIFSVEQAYRTLAGC
jgi:hypothetical protein